ncbi:MAG TPA: PfkB family carbohydrate kinase, partial [Desulfurivibrionaceae bacterium]|nr:PfkB family carbohydrate kinase [Desulfurivibrionaceae bacterium]
AYHLAGEGMEVGVITRVGCDPLGAETLARIGELGLPTEGVQRGREPTGTVQVTFPQPAEPHFEIVTPAAWDAIASEEALAYLAGRPFDLIFGTLAQRDERSRRTIRLLWERAEQRYYDVNLRPPFTTRELVLDSLAVADLVKLNGEELEVVAEWAGVAGPSRNAVARQLMARYNIAVLVVTEGADGAWLVAEGAIIEVPGHTVRVVDPVGAGDAFFAALLAGYRRGTPWPETLALANRLGAYVAAHPGATPPHPNAQQLKPYEDR